MKSIKHRILGLAIIGICSAALGQTDNGGGMGGTGITDKPQPMAPAMSEESCTKEKSIGIAQLRSAKDKKVKKQTYACSGQKFKTNSAEEIEILFRSGEKIKLLENSQMIIEKSPE
jgi:hypothetical protein